ncbi:MAG: hypothetical protein RI936_676, partial [Pseudomonadota bacterium]
MLVIEPGRLRLADLHQVWLAPVRVSLAPEA